MQTRARNLMSREVTGVSYLLVTWTCSLKATRISGRSCSWNTFTFSQIKVPFENRLLRTMGPVLPGLVWFLQVDHDPRVGHEPPGSPRQCPTAETPSPSPHTATEGDPNSSQVRTYWTPRQWHSQERRSASSHIPSPAGRALGTAGTRSLLLVLSRYLHRELKAIKQRDEALS